MNISDIPWNMVRMVSISDCTLRITTDLGVMTFQYDSAEELSLALLKLSLQGTKKIENIDEARFNPARFLDCYSSKPLAAAA